MSRRTFEIAYAGPAPDDHSMDVQELAPALLAVGQLIRESNTVLNGKTASVKVLVASDFEHKCFNINFELVQTIYDQLKTLIGSEDVKSAKDILEWLGILVGTPAMGAYSLWKLLAYLKGRKIIERREIVDQTGQGQVVLRIEGDANLVTINQNVAKLLDEPKVLKAVKDVLAPLKASNIDRLEFRDQGIVLNETTEQEAADIISSCEKPTGEASEELISPDITTWLKVYSPVYDTKAEKWRFVYQGNHIYADVTETRIVADAIARGGVLIDDVFKVKMTTTETLSKDNKVTTSYKIKEVLDFRPAPKQTAMDFGVTEENEEIELEPPELA